MKKEFSHPSFEYVNEGEEAIKVMVPVKKQVCPMCMGIGTHERQDIDCSKLVDSMVEDGDDEGLQRYYAGSFDVPCTCCNGKNVIDDFDTQYLVDNYPDHYEAMCDWDASEAEDARYSAQERACGA
jgi:RecJ-like exonuclease